MTDEGRMVRAVNFLIDAADNGGKLTMFEMAVPEQVRVPAAHSRF